MFITLEGGEGSGKTTLITRIKIELEKQGHTVFVSREPGGLNCQIAEEIRNVLLDPKNKGMDAWTEALLYAASRREHVEKVIKPALKEGKVVILDRYLDSSLAYQGYARGLGIERVLSLNEPSISGLWPDLTLFLDIMPKDGLSRVHLHRSNKDDRLDQESLAFHERVREGYLILEKRWPERIIRLDATASVESLLASALAEIGKRMKP